MTIRTVFLSVSAVAVLAFGTPSHAGTTYLTQAVFFNTGAPADDFEATFSGTGGTISDITVFNPANGVTASVTGTGDSIAIDFSPSIGSFQVLDFSFENTFGSDITFISGDWTYALTPPASAGSPLLLTTTTIQAVSEPASVALMGIGLIGLIAYCRLWRHSI
jgi:PEP-CTERM motif